MKHSFTGILVLLLASALFAQKAATTKNGTQMGAIVNLRKLAMAESAYAMGHPKEGFACDPQPLTKLEWPRSPEHAPLVDSALLSGVGKYKFSVKCANDSRPAGKLSIFAVPLNAREGLPTYCATGTFQTVPSRGTSEFPIRSIEEGNAENCLTSGKPLK